MFDEIRIQNRGWHKIPCWLVLFLSLATVSVRATTNVVINVVDYGVIGDGTNDDYPALLAANQALQAVLGSNPGSNASGELYFPPNLTCRIATAGVNGLVLSNRSNISLLMDTNTVLLMDNLANGLAISDGILIQGPCTNITMTGVHVRYASMPVARQGFAPIYILGAHVGDGATLVDGNYWMRGATNGAEDPAAIDAGAVKNVLLQNVTVENSPSAMVGIVGVDGITITNFTGINSWADGLYHLYFKNSLVTGAHLINCGDDAISMASYESDITNACITNSYHGEGSLVTNVTITGYWPTNGSYYVPAAGLAFLGVRDVAVSAVAINNRYRGVRFEAGFENFENNPAFNFNFLANQNLSISAVAITNCTQMIAIGNDAMTINGDPKWWQSAVEITNVNASGGDTTINVYGGNSGDSPLMSGFTIIGFNASGYAQPYGTFQNFINCTFANMQFDGTINFNGFVPYGGDPDATNAAGAPAYPAQNSDIANIRCQSVTFEGVKGCALDGIASSQAPEDGITFTTCGEVQFGSLSVTNANRTGWEWANGILFDSYNKNITGNLVTFNQDSQTIPNALNLSCTQGNAISQVTVITDLNTPSDLVYDQLYATTGKSQIQHISWFDGGYTGGTPQWQFLSWLTLPAMVDSVALDTDID